MNVLIGATGASGSSGYVRTFAKAMILLVAAFVCGVALALCAPQEAHAGQFGESVINRHAAEVARPSPADVSHVHAGETVDILFLKTPCTAVSDDKGIALAAFVKVKATGRILSACWADVGDAWYIVDEDGDSGRVPKPSQRPRREG